MVTVWNVTLDRPTSQPVGEKKKKKGPFMLLQSAQQLFLKWLKFTFGQVTMVTMHFNICTVQTRTQWSNETKKHNTKHSNTWWTRWKQRFMAGSDRECSVGWRCRSEEEIWMVAPEALQMRLSPTGLDVKCCRSSCLVNLNKCSSETTSDCRPPVVFICCFSRRSRIGARV